MWTFPFLLDRKPRFAAEPTKDSLLLVPLGAGTVLSHLLDRVRVVTQTPPAVVCRFDRDPAYERALRDECPDLGEILSLREFLDERIPTFRASDRLLLVDPEWFPADPADPALSRLDDPEDARGVSHLLARSEAGESTLERVIADASGRLRSVERYYDAVTWPLTGAAAWSLVPVSCLSVSYELPVDSLERLRRVLATEAVSSRDVPLGHGAFYLGAEDALLALNEHLVLSLARRRGSRGDEKRREGAKVQVHPTARLIGPVVVQPGAQVAEGATVIGPSVLGAGSHVGPGAIVSQSIVGRACTVPRQAELRQTVLLAPRDDGPAPLPHRAVFNPGSFRQTWPAGAPIDVAEVPRGRGYLAVKRTIDVLVASIVLPLLAPLAVLLAAAVKLESRGPVFFGHVREGMGGRSFRCWKFRTMRAGADVHQRSLQSLNQMDGPQFKLRDDPRRTRVGRLLTAANLDELPQFWNILVGDMSLVGPRPSPFRENQVCVPWREGRLEVRPGLTGLWQVCRHDREKSDFHQWIYYDLLYVRNLSLPLDLRILALTCLALPRGGYTPMSWLLPPRLYGERRGRARASRRPFGHGEGRRSSDRQSPEPLREDTSAEAVPAFTAGAAHPDS